MSENSGMTDALSNHIRAVDGSHSLGAGALAEKIMEFFQPIIAERDALRQSVKARKDLVYAGQPQCQSPQPATLPATPATDNGQGLDYTPGWLDLTAPARIWLQVDTSADNSDRDESWPCDDGVSWCHESVGGLEVQYVRADLAANPPAAGAGGSAVWVGVGPVNPTPMMIQAGARARQNGGTCEEVYRAMLAVAPAAPVSGHESALPATPDLPSELCEWLEARDLLPDADEHGAIYMDDIITALDMHEAELLNSTSVTPKNPRCGDERYELDAYIWRRDSTNSWVLEITGTINDTHFTVRHCEPLTTAPQDVAALPSLTATPESAEPVAGGAE